MTCVLTYFVVISSSNHLTKISRLRSETMNMPSLRKKLLDKELRLQVRKGKVAAIVEELRILKEQINVLKDREKGRVAKVSSDLEMERLSL